jgi:hypothetical protein
MSLLEAFPAPGYLLMPGFRPNLMAPLSSGWDRLVSKVFSDREKLWIRRIRAEGIVQKYVFERYIS